jgi:2-(1,2-epoxy-1,2-dihydrophenyl)acetyl-CoA isomerase
MEKPVLAAVNGIAAGAGASLALSCDIKICAEEAQFVNAFVRVGLVPDTGMTYDLPRFLGRSAAIEHAWTAKPISAKQALECGWVNRVVKLDELEAEALKFCESLAQNPPLAIALTKRAINRSLENTFSGQMEYEAQLQEILGKTQDHAEGISAFLEKRKPHFEGK